MGIRHRHRFRIDFERFVVPLEKLHALEPPKTLERHCGITRAKQLVGGEQQPDVLAQWHRTVHGSSMYCPNFGQEQYQPLMVSTSVY